MSVLCCTTKCYPQTHLKAHDVIDAACVSKNQRLQCRKLVQAVVRSRAVHLQPAGIEPLQCTPAVRALCAEHHVRQGIGCWDGAAMQAEAAEGSMGDPAVGVLVWRVLADDGIEAAGRQEGKAVEGEGGEGLQRGECIQA